MGGYLTDLSTLGFTNCLGHGECSKTQLYASFLLLLPFIMFWRDSATDLMQVSNGTLSMEVEFNNHPIVCADATIQNREQLTLRSVCTRSNIIAAPNIKKTCPT